MLIPRYLAVFHGGSNTLVSQELLVITEDRQMKCVFLGQGLYTHLTARVRLNFSFPLFQVYYLSLTPILT